MIMKKVQQAIQRIKVASHIAERHGERLTVCFSGGKDSQVMLHLVQRAGVPFHAVYNVTTIDHPANVNFCVLYIFFTMSVYIHIIFVYLQR